MPLPAQFFPVLSESAGEPVVLARRGTAAREVSAPPLLGGECLSAGRWRADGSVSASRLAATIIPAQGRIPQRVDLRIDAHSECSFVHVRAIRQPEMMSGSSHVRGVRIMRRVRRFPSRASLMRNSTTNLPATHFDRHRGCGAFAGSSLRPQREQAPAVRSSWCARSAGEPRDTVLGPDPVPPQRIRSSSVATATTCAAILRSSSASAPSSAAVPTSSAAQRNWNNRSCRSATSPAESTTASSGRPVRCTAPRRS